MRACQLTESQIPSGIVQILKHKGYKSLGAGVDQRAFLEPGTGMILKIFGTNKRNNGTDLSPAQGTFKAYADFCNKNPDNPFLPNFTGWETFQYNGKLYLQIRMERLFKFTKGAGRWGIYCSEFAYGVKEGKTKQRFLDEFLDSSWRTDEKHAFMVHLGDEGFDQLWNTIQALYDISERGGFKLDLHGGNFMLGSDGHIVISDPFFIGWGHSQ